MYFPTQCNWLQKWLLSVTVLDYLHNQQKQSCFVQKKTKNGEIWEKYHSFHQYIPLFGLFGTCQYECILHSLSWFTRYKSFKEGSEEYCFPSEFQTMCLWKTQKFWQIPKGWLPQWCWFLQGQKYVQWFIIWMEWSHWEWLNLFQCPRSYINLSMSMHAQLV